jgi:dUTP pyrophosphatase
MAKKQLHSNTPPAPVPGIGQATQSSTRASRARKAKQEQKTQDAATSAANITPAVESISYAEAIKKHTESVIKKPAPAQAPTNAPEWKPVMTPEVAFERRMIAGNIGNPIAPVLPTKAHESDTCYDLVATNMTHTRNYIEYGTGIHTEIPDGIWGDVRARSSISNHDLVLCNSTGVIDSQYRGEWKLRFKVVRHTRLGFFTRIWDNLVNTFTAPKIYKVGDKIAQVYFPKRGDVTWTERPINSNSVRGVGGFGSSDNKAHDASKKAYVGAGTTASGLSTDGGAFHVPVVAPR